jgi:hypothetical protein
MALIIKFRNRLRKGVLALRLEWMRCVWGMDIENGTRCISTTSVFDRNVTSRQEVWLFLVQLWSEFVPVLHRLQAGQSHLAQDAANALRMCRKNSSSQPARLSLMVSEPFDPALFIESGRDWLRAPESAVDSSC